MTEEEFQLIRAAGFVAAAGIAGGLQRLSPHARASGSWRVNLGLWCVNLLVMGLACGACACAVSRWATANRFGVLNVVDAPPLLAVLVSIVALDLVSYGWHRANHAFALLWRFHQVHHSDGAFTASTGVRFHPGELLLSLPVRLATVAAVGTPAVGVIVFEVVFAVANLVEHGDIDYPRWLERRAERLLVTPALHRRHHGLSGAFLGSNFGTVFSLWDRLLGTYGPSTSAAQIDVGLAHVRGTIGMLRALTLPLFPARVPSPR
jgi:sterol desaturase/sphingolipid hydroxylase (fatty acid hydroxylase superfamily)